MSSHEYAARQRKAARLANKLRAARITADEAKRLTPAEWAAVAERAGCAAPNSEATKQAVYEQLEGAPRPVLSIEEWERIFADS